MWLAPLRPTSVHLLDPNPITRGGYGHRAVGGGGVGTDHVDLRGPHTNADLSRDKGEGESVEEAARYPTSLINQLDTPKPHRLA